MPQVLTARSRRFAAILGRSSVGASLPVVSPAVTSPAVTSLMVTSPVVASPVVASSVVAPPVVASNCASPAETQPTRSLRAPAPAKLNLFLHVVGRRADGYHLLESVFRLIDWGDTLELTVRDDGQILRTAQLEGVSEESDLTLRAARLLQSHTGCKLGADISLTKRLPMGGGLGGGSSDAATVLLGLNQLWQTGLSMGVLGELGLTLGADVPFFIFGQSAFATGVGESLHPVRLPETWYVVVVPAAHVPTPLIFGQPTLTRDTKSVKILDFSDGSPGSFSGSFGETVSASSASHISFDAFSARNCFKNDLEPVASALFPEVGQVVSQLQQFAAQLGCDASLVRMTGSGACVFAPCRSELEAQQLQAALPSSWAVQVAKGLDQHPFFGLA
jgi:4-diphosphocytidyl-2-C-methyl-D-erythritol kinase